MQRWQPCKVSALGHGADALYALDTDRSSVRSGVLVIATGGLCNGIAKLKVNGTARAAAWPTVLTPAQGITPKTTAPPVKSPAPG